ncbi:hydroxyacylglutathione hydrolase family protein [Desulfuromonas sp. AOP6]|uniref:hydroxyacylglutathione hydrolase family protein n=1 Tax=Desulfuromonas sp. AOP6 TaxID=1566351 RepID=UPI0012749AF8|nr:hydroxyacylglutathione hydrolase family protein [Desulfuromonas sp. AOP6]BCA78497.1 hydroxyacylglutathione hydrolase [Desulfuromonas sp. AOP6]
MVTTAGLDIVQVSASDMDNFSYLLYCPTSKVGAAVDPSFWPERLLAEAKKRGVTIEILFNTHGHRDHVAGNAAILAETGARLAAHPLDVEAADIPVSDNQTFKLGEGALTVLHTPGHSPGSICLYTGDALLTGDTLFVTRVGRADLAGSDVEALYHSLRRLAGYPPGTRVFPGHDYGPVPASTLAYEQEHNPYLRCPDLASFIRLRLDVS